MKTELLNLTKAELTNAILEIGEKKFRAEQLWQWIYIHNEFDFSKMSSFSVALQQKLNEHFSIFRPKVIEHLKSVDGTNKWLLEFNDGQRIETVFIPEEDRGAVCVSTQVGCAVGCKFCHTGTQKLSRNLTSAEIISQFLLVRDYHKKELVSNIVVMGMGEPMHNFENTIKALQILNDNTGCALSKRKITLSSSGIANKIPEIAKKISVKLAISLHASNDEIRSKIMPINNKFNIDAVLKSCQEYQKITGYRQPITFEYLMLDGINDSFEDAKRLNHLMKTYKINAKFNLICFNSWDGCGFVGSSKNKVHAFSKRLQEYGFEAPIRASRGDDIMGACGQLKGIKNNLTL
ncbi:MAG: 23S rRNA (adenine(2503)-C(2))-methyltransferase RlmN [Alphaproteobacteria bacterium]